MASPVASSRFVSSTTIASVRGAAAALRLAVCRCRLAHQQPQHIRLRKILLPGAVADPLDRHRRQRAELVDQRRHDRRAGRRGQLALDIERRPSGTPRKQLARGRRRNRTAPVGNLDEAVPVGTGEQTTRSTPSRSKPIAGPHDVGDRIDRPHFVKVDLLDRRAVHLGLGLGQLAERSAWPTRCCRGESVLPSIIAVMWCRWRCLCSGSCSTVICVARKPRFLTSLAHEPAAWQAQRIDAGLDRGQVGPGIDQRPERHVAADSAGTIEIGNSHECSIC